MTQKTARWTTIEALREQGMTTDTGAARSFFGTDLRRSSWFWLTAGGLAGAVALGFLEIAERWGRAYLTSDAFVVLGLALAACGWLSCVGEFERIRKLPIDWEKLESGPPIYAVLESEVRLIRAGAFIPFLIAATFLCSLSP